MWEWKWEGSGLTFFGVERNSFTSLPAHCLHPEFVCFVSVRVLWCVSDIPELPVPAVPCRARCATRRAGAAPRWRRAARRCCWTSRPTATGACGFVVWGFGVSATFRIVS